MPPGAAPSPPEPTAQDASPSFRPPNPPAGHIADARRCLSDPIDGGGQLQPEAQVGHKRAIRSRIWANNCRGTATSASWKVTYLAWATTLAPILISFSRSVVSVQPWIGLGSTSWRRKLARL